MLRDRVGTRGGIRSGKESGARIREGNRKQERVRTACGRGSGHDAGQGRGRIKAIGRRRRQQLARELPEMWILESF